MTTTYETLQDYVAAQSVKSTLAAWAAFGVGTLTAAEFVTVAAGIIARADIAAAAVADGSLAIMLGRLALGIGRPDGERDRLVKSFTTLLDVVKEDPPEIARAKVERISDGEPRDAGREAFHEAMRANSDLVIGWTRKTTGPACALCRSLADGSVLPLTQAMYQHPHDRCVAVPVVREKELASAALPVAETSREFSTGYGIDRKVYRSPQPGLTFVTGGFRMGGE